jgi:shikimate kinase
LENDFQQLGKEALVQPETNLVLIGMPGAGKSTLGVLLAKALSRPFLDTDLEIQTRERQLLKAIIHDRGMAAFKSLEEGYILSLACRGHVIATGGSAVYSERAMRHLQKEGFLLFLDLSLPLLERRIRDMDARGVVRAPGQELEDLYRERRPLYQRYADTRVCCDDRGHEDLVREILSLLSG